MCNTMVLEKTEQDIKIFGYLYPELAKEWHPIKNKNKTPFDYTFGSNEEVWWRCYKNHQHEWIALINNRIRGAGCPYCIGKIVTEENSLATMSPELAKEWHPTKNGDLTPTKVFYKMNKKVWWRCSKGHEWDATINKRYKGTKCPYCTGRKVCKDNCLATLRPDVAKKWHPTKNEKTPYDFTCGSNEKAWWVCEKGHEYDMTINQAIQRSKCPYCDGKRVMKEDSFAMNYPELLKEWDYEKNKNINPFNYLPGSNKKFFWKCEKGHEWKDNIYVRCNGKPCPYCSNKRISEEYCLMVVNPDLAKEWHPTKNGNITPFDIFPSTNRKYWWKCKKGHEWEANVNSRNNRKSGCPKCNEMKRASYSEKVFNFYLKRYFVDALDNFIIPKKNKELDIYIPSIKFGLEYDGFFYHIPEVIQKKDLEKNKILYKKVTLVRIREKNLPIIDQYNVKNITRKGNNEDSLINTLKELFHYMINNIDIPEKVVKKMKKEVFDLKSDRKEINSFIEFFKVKNSISKKCPELIKEWHSIKNGDIQPEDVSYGSSQRIWWICEKGHEWDAIVSSRVRGCGCPYCSNQKVGVENSLAYHAPKFLKEWNYEKNKDFTPYDVTPVSGQRAWWICEKGHEWEAVISSRYKNNCPYCSGLKILRENSFAWQFPEFLKEWDWIKNNNIDPFTLAKSRKDKYWWICEKGHSYDMSLSNKSKCQGCPYCSGHRVCIDNCIATLRPDLVEEWHPTKNGSSTPYDYTLGSHEKKWWKCSVCEEEFERSIKDMNKSPRERRMCCKRNKNVAK